MRKICFPIAALILVVCGLWKANHGYPESEGGITTPSRAKHPDSESISDREPSGVFRTKVANREPAGPRATHAPERLKEFMLPEVVIDGLTLGEALQKLMGVYEETRGKTGETPLRLTFDLPPGNAKKLNLKLSPRNFHSSVQVLATYSGMKLSRNKTVYHFEPFPDERKQVSLAFEVPSDFASRLIEQARIPPLSCFEQFKFPSSVGAFPASLPLGAISGLDLDPSTQLTLGPSGSLKLETTSSADAAMISALTETLGAEKPILHTFTSKVVEIPADSVWTAPEVSQISDGQLQSLMREMAVTKGTELTTLPSITTKSGQQAKIEMIRELIVQTGDSATHFEKHDIGKVVNIAGNALGFGQETTIRYTDTTGGPDDTARRSSPSATPISRIPATPATADRALSCKPARTARRPCSSSPAS